MIELLRSIILNIWQTDFILGLTIRTPRTCGTSLISRDLADVEGVQHKYVMVVLRQSDDVSFGGDLEAAASAHLDVWALKLSDQRAVSLEHGHVESVAMTVADQHVTGIADVYAVWVVGDVLAADATDKLTVIVKNHHTVTLKWPE